MAKKKIIREEFREPITINEYPPWTVFKKVESISFDPKRNICQLNKKGKSEKIACEGLELQSINLRGVVTNSDIFVDLGYGKDIQIDDTSFIIKKGYQDKK